MRTSCASFSWARPAIRRACSIGVRGSSNPFLLATSVAIEAAPLDFPEDSFRNQSGDRLALRDSFAHVAGGDVGRLELEAENAVAVACEVWRWVARPRADREADPAQDLGRLLPAWKVTALVGADDEDRVTEAAAANRVDGERVCIDVDGGRKAVERGARKHESIVWIGHSARAMARTRTHEDDEPVDRQLSERGAGEGDVAVVRRIEGSAEDARGHCSSSASPATSTSSPDLAPASRSAASSSSSPGGRPTIRKPRSVRRIRNARRGSGFGR